MKRYQFLIFIFLISLSAFKTGEIGKNEFYKVFSDRNEEEINIMLASLEKEKPTSITAAYQGALYMKKADFVKGAKEKVRIFKKGAQLLEDEIAKKPANTEYRFLRLAIQEHAPKILKYNKNLDADKKVIVADYKGLDPELKKIIKAYAAGSKVLKSSDLQ